MTDPQPTGSLSWVCTGAPEEGYAQCHLGLTCQSLWGRGLGRLHFNKLHRRDP